MDWTIFITLKENTDNANEGNYNAIFILPLIIKELSHLYWVSFVSPTFPLVFLI